MQFIRTVLRLLLCAALVIGGVGHAPSALAWASPAHGQPCHDAATEDGMVMADAASATTAHRSSVPPSHRCCAPDACHCVGSSAASGQAATPPGVDRAMRRADWSSSLSTRYASVAPDTLLRPPIG